MFPDGASGVHLGRFWVAFAIAAKVRPYSDFAVTALLCLGSAFVEAAAESHFD